jgi:hypothetical protein
MGAQTLMQLLPKASNRDRSSVRNNDLRYAVIADDMRQIQLCILPDSVCGGYRYEVG